MTLHHLIAEDPTGEGGIHIYLCIAHEGHKGAFVYSSVVGKEVTGVPRPLLPISVFGEKIDPTPPLGTVDSKEETENTPEKHNILDKAKNVSEEIRTHRKK